MFENMNPMSKTTAGLEILIMIGVAFVLGYVVHLIICKTGGCGCEYCQRDSEEIEDKTQENKRKIKK